MGVNLAMAYIHLIPTVQNIQSTMREALAPGIAEAGVAGRSAGTRMSQELSTGLGGAASAAGAVGREGGTRMGSGLVDGVRRADVTGAVTEHGNRISEAAGSAGTSAGTGLGTKMMSAFAAVGVAAGIGKLISGSTDAAMQAAVDTNKTKRLTGGDTVGASQLNAQLMFSGVDQDRATLALQTFSKNLGNAGADAAKTAAMTQLLGESFKDANGAILPTTQLMGPLADKFKAMPNGAEKTALAMKLFGKSGADMIPMLNKGSEGLADLAKKSDELGLTLNDSQITAMANAKAAHREFEASIQGLKIALGSALLPAMTAVHKFMEGFLIPVLVKGTAVIKDISDRVGAAWKILAHGDIGSADPSSPLVEALMFAHDKFTEVNGQLQAAWGVLRTGDFPGAAAGIGEEDSPLVAGLLKAHDMVAQIGPTLKEAWSILSGGDFKGGLGLEEDSPLVDLMFKVRDFGLDTFGKLQGIWDTLKDTALALWDPIKSIASSLMDAFSSVRSLSGGMSPLEALWNGLLWAFQKIADLLKVTLVPAFTWLASFMKNNQPVVLTLVAAFVLWRTALMGIALWQGIVRAATAAWIAVQAALNAVMDANPIMLVVIALAALAAGVVWAYTNVGWFRDAVDTAWSFIKDATTSLWENGIKPFFNWIADNIHVVGDFFVAMWNAAQPVFDFLKSSFDNFLTIVRGVIDVIAGVFTGDWSRVWDGIKQIFTGIWDQIVNYVSLAWTLISGIGGQILGWLGSFAGWVWDRIVAMANQVVEWGSQFLSWLWDGIKNMAVNVFGWFTSLPGWIWDKIAALGATIVGFGAQFLSWVWDGIKNTAVSVFQWFKDLPANAWAGIVALVSTITGYGGSFIGWIKDGIILGAQGIWDYINAMPGAILDILTKIKDKILAVGSAIVGWIKDGIVAVASVIWDAITGALTGSPTVNADGKVAVNNLGVTLGAGGGVVSRAVIGANAVAAGGGVFPGYAPGVDSIHAMLSPGEGVMVPEFVQMVGPEWIYGMNAAARGGRYVSPDKILGVERFAAGGIAGTQARAKALGGELAWAEANKKIKEIQGQAASGGVNLSGFTTSQDPSSFGWQRASNIVPFNFAGQTIGVAGGTAGLWNALLSALAPSIPGGIQTLGGYENRSNVNNPSAVSFHAYGLATDINAPWNPNGVSGYGRSGQYVIPSGPAHSLAARFGMLWGGDFNGTPDPMHFEIHLPPSAIGGAAAGTLGQAAAPGAVGYSSTAGVEQWRGLSLQALTAVGNYLGRPLTQYINQLLNQMRTESSGNPNAINLTDINAQRGYPSQGLLQVIRPTFDTALRGTPFANLISRPLTDPWANIVASILYGEVTGPYHSLAKAYQGHAYDSGGWLKPGATGANFLTQPEAVLTPPQSQALITHARNLEAGFNGGVIRIELAGDGPITEAALGAARVTVDGAMQDFALTVRRNGVRS